MYKRGNWAYADEGASGEGESGAAPPSPPWKALKDLPASTSMVVDGKRVSSRATKAQDDKKKRDEEDRARKEHDEAERRERERERRERLQAKKKRELVERKARETVDAAIKASKKKPRASAPAALQIPALASLDALDASARSPARTATTTLATVVEADDDAVPSENLNDEGAAIEASKKPKVRPGDALKAIRAGGAGIAADLKLLAAGVAAKAAATASLPTPNPDSSFDLAHAGFDLYGDDSDLSSVPPSSEDESSDDDVKPARKRQKRVRKHGLPTPSASSGGSFDSPPRRRAKTSKDILEPKGKDRKAFLTAGLYSSAFKNEEKSGARRASAPAPGSLGFTASGNPRKPAGSFASVDHTAVLPLPINYGVFVLCPPQPRDFRLPFDIYSDYASDLQGDAEAERERLDRLGKGKKPDKYERLRTNAYPFRKIEKSEIPPAVCHCNDGDCSEGCINWMMQYLCTPASCPRGGACTNGPLHLRKDGLEESTKPGTGLKVFFTGPRGFGLRTEVPIEKGKFVLEYRGEVISRDESYRRVLNEYRGKKSFYFLDYDGYDVLDAGMRGNCARFINHSCDPNLRVVRFKLSGLEEYQIGLFALRDIAPGTELTYDYKWENFADLAPSTSDVRTTVADDGTTTTDSTTSSSAVIAPAPAAQRCLCGSANCIGLLGAKRKKDDEKDKKLKAGLLKKKGKKRKRKVQPKEILKAAAREMLATVTAATEKLAEELVEEVDAEDEEEEEEGEEVDEVLPAGEPMAIE